MFLRPFLSPFPSGPLRRSRARQLRGRPIGHPGGFSMMELLVGGVISLIVLVAAVQSLLALVQSDRDTQVELNRKDTLGRVLGLIQDEIRNAQRVESGTLAAPLARLDSSNCPTSSVQTVLILRGSSGNEDISYGLLTTSGTNWRGPAVLVRCGPTYNNDGALDAGTTASPRRSEQVVMDSLQSNGFSATTLGGSGSIQRHVELTLTGSAAGSTSSTVQVPISTNMLFGLNSNGSISCVGGGSLSSGCLDSNGQTKHYRPTLGGTDIAGSASLEDVFYFDGKRSDYTLSETPGSGNCDHDKCTVRLGAAGNSITFYDGDVLIFKDIEIRL